jgi:ribosomal protein S21
MYQDKLLKSYLINYIKYIKEEKLEKDINQITTLRNQIGGFLERCYNKYDGLEQIIRSENRFNEKKYKNLCIQYGGETLEAKITRIIDLGKAYNKLDPIKIKENINKITSSVDEVTNKLQSILGTSISPDKFIDDLESVLSEIKLAGDKFELNSRRNKIYIPEKEAHPILDTKIQNLYNIIVQYVNDVSNNQTSLKQDPKYSDRIKEIELKLSGELKSVNLTNLSDKITNINKKNNELLQKIKLINESMETKDEDVSDKNIKMFKNIKSMLYIAKKYPNKPKVKELYDILQNDISKLSEFKEKNNLLNIFFEKNKNDNDLKETQLIPIGGIYPNFENIFTASIDASIVTSGTTLINLNALKNILILDDENLNDAAAVDNVLTKIYKPNLEEFKSKPKPTQTAGLLDISQLVIKQGNKNQDLDKVLKIINEYNTAFDSYVSNVKKYNKLSYYSYIHTLFLGGIITNKIMENGSKIYIYLNKGIIELFKRTLNEITPKLEDITDNTAIIMYLRKYHYVTIKTLNNFINKLSNTMSSRDIIDVSRCTGKALQKIILFNYFKDILSSYKSMFQNQVTIYARINDIRTKDKEGGQYGYEYEDAQIHKDTDKGYDTSYFTAKMFASDYDRKNIIQLRNNKKIALDKDGNVQYDDKILQNTDNAVDTKIMYVRPKACGIKPIDESLVPDPTMDQQMNNVNYRTKYQFTEVFDTDNFQDNEEISKSMLMDVQLGEKKGIAMLTYGYSGTGKTFTLFGSKSAGASGILQATLKNIKGLSSLKFRLFELYGYGQVYPFYWTQGADDIIKQAIRKTIDDKKKNENIDMTYEQAEAEVRKDKTLQTNLDMIRHFIIEYNLTKNDKDGITISQDGKKINVINANDIASYTKRNPNKDPGFIEIQGASIIEDTLKTFDIFADKVETERVNGHKIPKYDNAKDEDDYYIVKTVRDTPNNVASSRSVLVYDFRLEVGYTTSTNGSPPPEKEYVSFLIIDLPGKEEIIPSYVTPYFNDPVIQKIMSLKYVPTDINYKDLTDNANKDTLLKKDEGLKAINSDFYNKIIFLKAMTASFGLNPMGLPLFGIDTGKNEAILNKKIFSDIILRQNETLPEAIKNKNKINTDAILNKRTKLAYYEKITVEEKKKAITTKIDTIVEKIDDTGTNFFGERSKFSSGSTVPGTLSAWIDPDLKVIAASNPAYETAQRESVAAIHMINRLALVGRFDLIEKIYELFAKEYINFFDVKKTGNIYNIVYDTKTIDISTFDVNYIRKIKGSLIVELLKKNYGDKNYSNLVGFTTFDDLHSNVDEKDMIHIYKKLFNYDYFLQPLEGIYINENIVGLIKFLADTLTVSTSRDEEPDRDPLTNDIITRRERTLRDITPLQDKSLSFIKKQQESRYKLTGANTYTPYNSGDTNTAYYYIFKKPNEQPFFTVKGTKYDYNYDSIKDTFDDLNSTYKSNNIYNFNKPIITDILKPYLENKEASEKENKDRIKDFKVFYLFGNYTDNNLRKLKCVQQVDLLNNTTKFIDMIAKQEK